MKSLFFCIEDSQYRCYECGIEEASHDRESDLLSDRDLSQTSEIFIEGKGLYASGDSKTGKYDP